MATPVVMPKLGLTMTEGEIKEWRKNEGENVAQGEVLYVLETEKVTYEVEAPASGILGPILAAVGDVVPVGEVVSYILEPGEELPADLSKKSLSQKAPAPAPDATGEAVQRVEATSKVKASPLAKRIAQEMGVDITRVKGSGPGGRITKEDILKFAEEAKAESPAAASGAQTAPVAPAAEDKVVPLTSMRRTIAKRMSESTRTAPHFWITVTADVTNLKLAREKLLAELEAKTGVRVTLTDFLVKICATALKEHPEINTSWTDDGIKFISDVNIGIAASVEGGLVVPVIRNADQKSIMQIAADRAEIVKKARTQKLTPDDLTGGTFTLNNLGMFGIENANVIINPPESAILLVGSTTERAVVIDGEICVRPMMSMTLALDHRVLDGVTGARFLTRVKQFVESPIYLMASL